MTGKLIITLLIVWAVYTGLMMIGITMEVNKKEYRHGFTRMQVIKGCLDSQRENNIRKIMIYNTANLFFAVLLIVSAVAYVFLVNDVKMVILIAALSAIGTFLRTRYRKIVNDFLREMN